MLIELRRYIVLPGRMPDMHARMSAMLLPLFAEHGIPRPRAIWTNEAETSTMTWVVEWPDFETRTAAWARFFPVFVAARQAQGTPEFVTRTILTVLAPWPNAQIGYDPASICESLWHVQPRIGHGAGFAATATQTTFPDFRAAGATSVNAANLVFGALPAGVVLLGWPDPETRERGMAQIAATDLGALDEALSGNAPTFATRGDWETLDRVPYLQA